MLFFGSLYDILPQRNNYCIWCTVWQFNIQIDDEESSVKILFKEYQSKQTMKQQ